MDKFLAAAALMMLYRSRVQEWEQSAAEGAPFMGELNENEERNEEVPDTVDNGHGKEVYDRRRLPEEPYSSSREHNDALRVYNEEMTPIGDGNAYVPVRILKSIDWTSHTKATRKLLQTIFTRKTLATHSLTGRPSPAFMDKPPKRVLDTLIVEAIVKTVCRRCHVSTTLVRTAITRKCSDEAKLCRKRCRLRCAARRRSNNENIPPPSAHP